MQQKNKKHPNNFDRNVDVTDAGTQEIKELYWDLLGYRYIDKQDDEEFRLIDTDFIVYNPNHQLVTVEIKVCNNGHITGNIAVEELENIRTNRKGWIYICKADYLYIYWFYSKDLFIIERKSFYDFYINHWNRFNEAEVTNGSSESRIKLVPLWMLKKYFSNLEHHNLNNILRDINDTV